MALITADRVKETSTTTGTGTLTLAGAVNGFKSFADIGNGNQCYYAIVGVAVPSEWEVGIGTYTASGTTLSRDTVLRSSTGSKVSFSAGTKEVFVTYPADKAVFKDDIVMISNQLIMHPNRIDESISIPDGYNAFFIDPVEFGPNVTVTGLGNSTFRGI